LQMIRCLVHIISPRHHQACKPLTPKLTRLTSCAPGLASCCECRGPGNYSCHSSSLAALFQFGLINRKSGGTISSDITVQEYVGLRLYRLHSGCSLECPQLLAHRFLWIGSSRAISHVAVQCCLRGCTSRHSFGGDRHFPITWSHPRVQSPSALPGADACSHPRTVESAQSHRTSAYNCACDKCAEVTSSLLSSHLSSSPLNTVLCYSVVGLNPRMGGVAR
jgi:hypothetical protein